MKKIAVFAVLILGFLSQGAGAETVCARPVATESGLVRGAEAEEPGVCEWKGIPYAAPPTGELRWTSPKPHPGWEGVRDAVEFGPACMQKGIMAVEMRFTHLPMSEDCLYLNIWAPAKSGRFPVMVWIHGGGYYGGNGATPFYWGDRLAAKYEVVVVTFNYRLNVFGFFAHPELREEDPHGATGGYGSLDQVRALQWVHDNIANFGGDPDNVTIFGESAGGWSICTMVATPLTKGLFHRAILESGGCEQSEDLESAYEKAKKVAEAVGCDFSDLDCLRKVPSKKLLEKGSGGMTKGIDAMPAHDGYLLTDTPLKMIEAGNYNHVPFMVGHNRDEFGKALKLMPRFYYARPKKYRSMLVEELGLTEEEAARAIELYPLSEFNNRPVEAFGRMFGVDLAFACPGFYALRAASTQQKHTYFYRFEYDNLRFAKYAGSAHSFEIPFVFFNLDRMPATWLIKEKHMQEAEKMARIVSAYWTNFAKTGDPNEPGLPPWPEFRPESMNIQVLDLPVRTEEAGPFAEKCSFWEGYLSRGGSGFEALTRGKK